MGLYFVVSQRRIRVVQVVCALERGGAERLVIDLCRHLDPARLEVAVATVMGGGPLALELHGLGIPVTFGGRRRRRPGLIALARLADLFRRFQPDIVHTHLFAGDTWGRLAALSLPGPGPAGAGGRELSTFPEASSATPAAGRPAAAPGGVEISVFPDAAGSTPAAGGPGAGAPGGLDLPRRPILISTEHNLNLEESFHHRWLKRRLAPFTDRIVAVSEAVRRHAVDLEGLPADRMTVIPNGIDLDRFPPVRSGDPGPGHRLIAVGRLVPQKGLEVLIDAIALARSAGAPVPPGIERPPVDGVPVLPGLERPPVDGVPVLPGLERPPVDGVPVLPGLERLPADGVPVLPGLELTIVGDGPLRPALEARAREKGVASRIRFVGAQTEVAGWLKEADILVQPSRWEGFGLTVIEAMATGLPVVVSSVGGLEEVVVPGETGLLVPPESPRALADALISLSRDADRRAAMGQAGAARARAFYAIEAVAARYAALYLDCITGRSVVQ
jgi:glycosyltransferase involved in cell wall biosynthesis